MNIKDKRFLITQPVFHRYCGSVVVTIELAIFLMENGAKVDVYTFTSDESIKRRLENKGINVYMPHDSEKLNLFKYDYIWIHSQVLPESIVKQLPKLANAPKRPFFIFLHMSPHDYIPDEFQWIYTFEENLADIVLYISEEVRENHNILFTKPIVESYFRNPCPKKFSNNNAPDKLKKVLIVSNHAPKEIEEAVSILRKKKITVHHLGDNGRKTKLISPKDIKEYDAIITIGKTVQYCILGKRPTYIYDIFGGAGYLTRRNYRENKKLNFSGRGFSKKEPNIIADEIIKGWADAKKEITSISRKYSAEYTLDNSIKDILEILSTNGIKNIQINYNQSLSFYYAQRLIQYRFYDQYRVFMLEKENEILGNKLSDITEMNKRLYKPNIFIRIGKKINYPRSQKTPKAIQK